MTTWCTCDVCGKDMRAKRPNGGAPTLTVQVIRGVELVKVPGVPCALVDDQHLCSPKCAAAYLRKCADIVEAL